MQLHYEVLLEKIKICKSYTNIIEKYENTVAILIIYKKKNIFYEKRLSICKTFITFCIIIYSELFVV